MIRHFLLLLILLIVSLITPLAAAPVQTSKLDNGLTVIIRPVTGAQHTALLTLFKFGGASDPIGQSGRAHLLEHMYITAAAGKTSAQSVQRIVGRYPQGFNAQTGSDYTVIATVFAPDKLESELREAAARMGKLKINESDIKRELPRLLNEVNNMYGGIPRIAAMNHVRSRLMPITGGGQHGGHPDHVRKITAASLQQTWKDYYKSDNAILVLAGVVDADQVSKLIKQHFASIPRGKQPPKGPAAAAAQKTATTHRVTVKAVVPNAQDMVAFGYIPPKPGDAHFPAYIVFSSRLMIAGLKSRQPGLGQMLPVYLRILDDPTLFGLQGQVTTKPGRQEKLNALDQQFKQSLTAKITDADRAQAGHLASMMFADSPDLMLARNLYGAAFGTARRFQLGIDPAKLKKAIAKVTDADLQRLGKTVFDKTNRATVVLEVKR